MEVLSDALRVETRPFGINIVVIQPGAIQSEWSGIAAQTLKETSSESVYSEMAEPMAKLLNDYPTASSPEVVAKAVSKAVNSHKPRRRYATPLDAKVLIFLRWLLPDWAWESLIAAALK